MTQVEKDKIIAELQEKLAEAEKIEVDVNRWKPEPGKFYYHLNCYGDTIRDSWLRTEGDEWCYLTGNCFKTKDEVKEYQKKIEYTAHYKKYIEEHSEPLDWENNWQEKYCARYHYGTQEIEVTDLCSLKFQGIIYASSEQIIRDAIKQIGEENFKKYILEVK